MKQQKWDFPVSLIAMAAGAFDNLAIITKYEIQKFDGTNRISVFMPKGSTIRRGPPGQKAYNLKPYDFAAHTRGFLRVIYPLRL